VRRHEEKTPSKLAYRGVFCDMAVYGESRTTDGHEVSGGCARTHRQWDAMQIDCVRLYWLCFVENVYIDSLHIADKRIIIYLVEIICKKGV
jgi:hypothetical protein